MITSPEIHKPKSVRLADLRSDVRMLALTLSLLAFMAVLAASMALITQSVFAQTSAKGQAQPLSGKGRPSNLPNCSPDWTLVSNPQPGANYDRLTGVAAVSANDAWAVGSADIGSYIKVTIEHWDGAAWSAALAPAPPSTGSEFLSVAAISADNIWAVGYFDNPFHTLIEHWNGSAWNVVSSPNASNNNNFLYGVTAVSANDIWAVGWYDTGTYQLSKTLTMHWDGSAWSVVPSPNRNPSTNGNDFPAVNAISANDVWAVGDSYNRTASTDHYLLEHWDGTAWSVVSGPDLNSTSSRLFGVAAVSPNDVWAVGGYRPSNSEYQTLILHWDGTQWTATASPNPPHFSELYAVTSIATDDVWAVGQLVNNNTAGAQTLVAHWDGSVWSTFPSPNPGSSPYEQALFAVSAASANDVWAVGSYFANANMNPTHSIIEHYNSCAATPTPGGPTLTPTTTLTATPTHCTSNSKTCLALAPSIHMCSAWPAKGLSQAMPVVALMSHATPTMTHISGHRTTSPEARSPRLSRTLPGYTALSVVRPSRTCRRSTFYTYIERLYALGVTNGFACGGPGEPCVPPLNRRYYRPHDNSTRGQVTKIVSKTAGFSDPPTGQNFQDITPSSSYYPFAYRMVIRGIMSGYACGGTSRPCVPPNDLPYFEPNSDVTRAQTAKIVSKTFDPNCQTP